MMFKVVETFSGIGAQAKALERISAKTGFKHEIVNTCDWDIGAIISYCLIHKGKLNISKYESVSDEQISEYLSGLTLSMDGKKPAREKTFSKIPSDVKRLVYTAILETKNLVSITDVKGADIPADIDLLTYSFPCQDLSLCGCWHGNKSGIARDAHNRSGMLWEVERILMEMNELNIQLPRFLVMENVTNILSSTHRVDFQDWQNTLVNLGYYNKIYRLNSKNFGVPQKRERAYMISIFIDNDLMQLMRLSQYFEENDLEDLEVAARYRDRVFRVEDVLRMDYSNVDYRSEADANRPNDTPSREKIFLENDMLFDGVSIKDMYINTVTTKQDRNPNSGLVTLPYEAEGKTKWRYLTPRECFMFMGFDEADYEKAISVNPEYATGKKLLTNEKMIKMAGNSICVDVLVALFKQIIEIDEMLFKNCSIVK